MKKRHLLKTIQDTRNTVHRTMMPQSPSKLPWDFTQFFQSPSAAPSCFRESHQRSEISSLSMVILVWGKARSHRVPNLGYRGAESPGWFDVSPKNSVQDVMHEVSYHDEAANHQLPTAAALWIIWIVSTAEGSSLTQNLMQIRCPPHSVTLNVMATPYMCSRNGIYHLQWLIQWSRHCSHTHIPVYFPWLPVCIDVTQC